MTSSILSHFSYVLFLQLLSRGSTDVPMLVVEVTRVLEAAADAEVARVMAMLAAKTSAQEATVARDNAALCVKDVEDWTALVERVALERVSRVEVENTMALASAREDAKGFVRKITLLEDELAVERQNREVSERED
jgi:class 3 adenylate cyclase